MKTKPSKKQFELNAKWTALNEIQGWQHFRVCTRRNGNDGIEVELMALCDRSVRFWLPRLELIDPVKWAVGWLDLDKEKTR